MKNAFIFLFTSRYAIKMYQKYFRIIFYTVSTPKLVSRTHGSTELHYSFPIASFVFPRKQRTDIKNTITALNRESFH